MRRSVLALALASTLTATPAASLFQPLWSFLSFFWGDSSAKAGAGWDPWGQSLTLPQPTTDEGAGWDPSGSR
jgi:hypothetical protein